MSLFFQSAVKCDNTQLRSHLYNPDRAFKFLQDRETALLQDNDPAVLSSSAAPTPKSTSPRSASPSSSPSNAPLPSAADQQKQQDATASRLVKSWSWTEKGNSLLMRTVSGNRLASTASSAAAATGEAATVGSGAGGGGGGGGDAAADTLARRNSPASTGGPPLSSSSSSSVSPSSVSAAGFGGATGNNSDDNSSKRSPSPVLPADDSSSAASPPTKSLSSHQLHLQRRRQKQRQQQSSASSPPSASASRCLALFARVRTFSKEVEHNTERILSQFEKKRGNDHNENAFTHDESHLEMHLPDAVTDEGRAVLGQGEEWHQFLKTHEKSGHHEKQRSEAQKESVQKLEECVTGARDRLDGAVGLGMAVYRESINQRFMRLKLEAQAKAGL